MFSQCLLVALTLAFSDPTYQEMVRIRRHLHQNPELSNREFKTSAYLHNELRKAGFTNIEKLAKTGLKVVHDTGKPGPVLAFRADIDGLPIDEKTGLPFASKNPGVMHGCGHDLHTAILFGTALEIKKADDLVGSFVFLFQPAEEGPPPGEDGGANLMIGEGALENPKPDVIFGLHVMGFLDVGQVGHRKGGIMARADRFRIRIKGEQAHGSTPHDGVDPIYIASQVISATQSIVSRRTDARLPVVISFGQIKGGTRFNIIPEEVTMNGTIRTFDVALGNQVPELLDKVIAGVTSAHGGNYVFENETLCPSTQNDPEWTDRAVTVFKEAGLKTIEVQPVMAAEDFAYFAEKIPGVYFFLGARDGDQTSHIHKPDFSPSERAMQTGLSMYMALVRAFSGANGVPEL